MGFAEEKISAYAGSGAMNGQVGGVTMDVYYHVAGLKSNCGVWMGSAVIEELNGSIHGGFGALGLD